MRILKSKVMGFCFGVRDAIALTEEVSNPGDVTILGELVHNEQILVQLQRRGFLSVSETQRTESPASKAVLITAHGISDARRQQLRDVGKQLIDTTCPLVRNVHRAAQRLANEGRHVIVIGRRQHVEVQGIVEDLPSFSVFSRADEVTCTGYDKLGVISQSTTSPTAAQAVRRRIAELHPGADIRWIDTICQPTKDRQQSVLDLLPEIDILVVVGGAHSNNSRALADLARQADVRVFHVQSAAELQREWFADEDCVGLTAGTSTPDGSIDEVFQLLQQWASSDP